MDVESTTSMGCLLHAPYQGVEPTTFLCTGGRPTELHEPGQYFFVMESY